MSSVSSAHDLSTVCRRVPVPLHQVHLDRPEPAHHKQFVRPSFITPSSCTFVGTSVKRSCRSRRLRSWSPSPLPSPAAPLAPPSPGGGAGAPAAMKMTGDAAAGRDRRGSARRVHARGEGAWGLPSVAPVDGTKVGNVSIVGGGGTCETGSGNASPVTENDGTDSAGKRRLRGVDGVGAGDPGGWGGGEVGLRIGSGRGLCRHRCRGEEA